MIHCHLAPVLSEYKMRISDVAYKPGLSGATVTSLYKETAQKVNLEAVDKLCDLFDCEISELLKRTNSTLLHSRQDIIRD